MEKRLTMVRQSHQLILSRDIDYQRILESDWAKGTPGHTQKRVVILDTTFPDDYLNINIKDITWLFPLILLIKDGTRHTNSYTQPKVVASGTIFF